MPTVYAYRTDDSTILEVASGGAFNDLARAFFQEHPEHAVVYGAAFTSLFDIQTQPAYSYLECTAFRGSKYAQCDYTESLKSVAEHLKQGYYVMYSGVPCQIFALRSFLEKNCVPMDKLTLIDVICHGMPQKKVWDDYKRKIEQEYSGKLMEFSFRYKKTKSIEPVVRAKFDNGKVVIDSHLLRSYFDLYFTYMPLRSSCYSCKFSNMNRIGDITIGDFWGIEDLIPEFPSDKGVSEIIVNSGKGEHAVLSLIQLNPNATAMEYCGDGYIQYQHNLMKPTERPSNLNEFWGDYRENGFEFILRKYAKYTFAGKIESYIKRILRHTGLRTVLKKIRR